MDGDFVSRLLMILGTYPDLDLKNNVPAAFSQSYGGYRTISDRTYVVQIGKFPPKYNIMPEGLVVGWPLLNSSSVAVGDWALSGGPEFYSCTRLAKRIFSYVLRWSAIVISQDIARPYSRHKVYVGINIPPDEINLPSNTLNFVQYDIITRWYRQCYQLHWNFMGGLFVTINFGLFLVVYCFLLLLCR